MATITITRTPLITVPLNQLRLGMKVVNEKEEIGTITYLDMCDSNISPIRVHYSTPYERYYTADGFYYPEVSDCFCIHELHMGIKLLDNQPDEINSTNAQPDIQNNGLTDTEMEAVNVLVNNRGMTLVPKQS